MTTVDSLETPLCNVAEAPRYLGVSDSTFPASHHLYADGAEVLYDFGPDSVQRTAPSAQ